MERDKLFAALSKAQGEFPPIGRERTVRIMQKSGQEYSFNYAPLDVILAKVRPALCKYGLAIVQLVDGGNLITILGHESGQQLTATMPLNAVSDIKAWGSEITYCRRYALQAILGIAAEEDDDDATPGKSKPRERKAQPEQRPEPTPAEQMTVGKTPTVTFEDPMAFKAAADDLARRVPHYQTATGATNKMHIMNALKALSYTRITADNIAQAIHDLEQHARERADAQAATE